MSKFDEIIRGTDFPTIKNIRFDMISNTYNKNRLLITCSKNIITKSMHHFNVNNVQMFVHH